LMPEGIGEVEDKETLGDLSDNLSHAVGSSYSEGEDELLKITDELSHITTSSEFFEQEKIRQRELRDSERAQDLREAILIGEAVEEKDKRWLERYEMAKLSETQGDQEVAFVTEGLDDSGVGAESLDSEKL
jgi:segregation and condensation protein B